MASLAIGGWATARHLDVRLTRRQSLAWAAGLVSLWLATDWPLGALGSGYLASAHMLQYILYTFVAAPLLLLAVPEPLADALLGNLGRRVAGAVSRPLPAAIVANLVLLGTHAPWTVDSVRVSQIGSFALDVVWLVGGLVMWLPILSPIREHRASPMIQVVYLFLAAGLAPMVPGGFLTFADGPLYQLYELAPRVEGIDPISDQQAAGALMKVGNIPLIWPVIGVIFIRAARREAGPTEPTRQPSDTTPPPDRKHLQGASSS